MVRGECGGAVGSGAESGLGIHERVILECAPGPPPLLPRRLLLFLHAVPDHLLLQALRPQPGGPRRGRALHGRRYEHHLNLCEPACRLEVAVAAVDFLHTSRWQSLSEHRAVTASPAALAPTQQGPRPDRATSKLLLPRARGLEQELLVELSVAGFLVEVEENVRPKAKKVRTLDKVSTLHHPVHARALLSRTFSFYPPPDISAITSAGGVGAERARPSFVRRATPIESVPQPRSR